MTRKQFFLRVLAAFGLVPLTDVVWDYALASGTTYTRGTFRSNYHEIFTRQDGKWWKDGEPGSFILPEKSGKQVKWFRKETV